MLTLLTANHAHARWSHVKTRSQCRPTRWCQNSPHYLNSGTVPRACSGLHCQPQAGLKADSRRLKCSKCSAGQQQHTARLHCAGRATGADRCRQPSTVRAAVYGLLAVLLTLGKLGAAATALTAGQPAAIVAAAPARLRFVAPSSPPRARRGNGSSMCQSHILCGCTCTHGGDDTRGAGREPQLPRAPTGAYPGHSQQGHTIPVPKDSSPRVARCNLAEQLLMAAGPLLWLFGSMALLDSVVRRRRSLRPPSQ